MIDILYIKGKPSDNQDEEMKYSLRTLQRHVLDAGRVFITGQCPDFINQEEVIFTPVEDIGAPMINHWWKVDQTIRKTDISQNFVLMYDDIFFVKDVKLSKYPLYNKGFLWEIQTGGPVYQQSLRNANEWLYENYKTGYDFELHIPFIYNKTKFKRLREVFEKIRGEYPGMAVRSVYGNLYQPDDKRIYRRDIKIRLPNEWPQEVIGNADCFSVSDFAFQFRTKQYLEENYKERSKYEK